MQDAFSGIGTLPQSERRDFSDIGYEEAISASGFASQTSRWVSSP